MVEREEVDRAIRDAESLLRDTKESEMLPYLVRKVRTDQLQNIIRVIVKLAGR